MAQICTIDGCDKPAVSRSMCKRHYDQWWAKTPAKERPVPQIELRQMTETELAWVAGLIEGEGTFFCTKRRERRYPVIAVGMTDEDVIQKLYLLVGVGDIFITTIRGLMKRPASHGSFRGRLMFLR